MTLNPLEIIVVDGFFTTCDNLKDFSASLYLKDQSESQTLDLKRYYNFFIIINF